MSTSKRVTAEQLATLAATTDERGCATIDKSECPCCGEDLNVIVFHGSETRVTVVQKYHPDAEAMLEAMAAMECN